MKLLYIILFLISGNFALGQTNTSLVPADSILKSQNIFLRKDTIGGIECSIGYIKKFRWLWGAVQINTFIIIGSTNERVDRETIENFSKSCFKYSLKNNKGWPRGFQSAVASISILQAKYIDPNAINFCEELSKRHWAAYEIPVIYDLKKRESIRFESFPIFGAAYYPYLSKVLNSTINQFH